MLLESRQKKKVTQEGLNSEVYAFIPCLIHDSSLDLVPEVGGNPRFVMRHCLTLDLAKALPHISGRFFCVADPLPLEVVGENEAL